MFNWMKTKVLKYLIEGFSAAALICISAVSTYFLATKYTVVTDNEKNWFLDEDGISKPTKFTYKGKDYSYTSRIRNTQFYVNTNTSDIVGFIIDPDRFERLKELFPNDYKNYEYETHYRFSYSEETFAILKLEDYETSDRLAVRFDDKTLNVYIG